MNESQQPPQHGLAPGRRMIWAAGGVIVVAGWVAYHNSFGGPLVLDDPIAITDNPSIRRLWPLAAVLSPPENSTVGGRPLVNLTFALNYALGGDAVRGYHVVNWVIHMCAALALFGIVRRTMIRLAMAGAPVASTAISHAGPLRVALTAALLWTVHPLVTATVTYVSQRAEALMALYYLLTLYAFIRGATSSSPRWLVLSVACCALGMASKEVMVTAPVVVLVYDWIFVAGTLREAWRRRAFYYVALGATWLLLGYLMRELGQRSVGFDQGVSWRFYAQTECQAVLLYLRLALWPHPLIFDYGPVYLTGWAAVPYAFGVVMLLTGVIWAMGRRIAAGFLGACFFVLLAPTSSVVPIAAQPIAENRAYLPAAVVSVLVALGLHVVAGRRTQVLLPALAGAACLLSIQRNEVYRTESGLWADTLAKRPASARAHNNFGKLLFDAGQTAEAIAHYEEAMRLQRDYADAASNLGAALSNLGAANFQLRRFDAAIEYEQRALQVAPHLAMAHCNIAGAFNEVGRFQEAAAHAEQSLRLNPSLRMGHFNLGNALVRMGQPAAALAHYEAEIKLSPRFPDVRTNLGSALYMLHQPEKAIPHYEAALQLQGNLVEPRQNLASALFQAGRTEEAIAQYRAVLAMQPEHVEARANLALVLMRLGRAKEAKAEFEQVLRRQPDHPAAQQALGLLRSAERADAPR